MTRQIHKNVDSAKAQDLEADIIPVIQLDGTDHLQEDDETAKDDMSSEPRGFTNNPWTDINLGYDSHFRSFSIAGIEVTYTGTKDYLTVHLCGEHRFKFPESSLTDKDLSRFAVKCVAQVLSEQIDIFKKEARVFNVELEV